MMAVTACRTIHRGGHVRLQGIRRCPCRSGPVMTCLTISRSINNFELVIFRMIKTCASPGRPGSVTLRTLICGTYMAGIYKLRRIAGVLVPLNNVIAVAIDTQHCL